MGNTKTHLEREMTLKTTKLRDAISLALAVGVTTLAGTGVAFAQDAAATPSTDADQAKTLDRIEVTGSRIRRVDAENASPVVTIDRQAIEKTGKLTIGDLVQELPNIAGAATNPTVNNGGGTGASTVELRGLGSQRTLILINGRRMLHLGGADGGADVNAIPASAVERIEVLTVGASSVYGSDAVAGVVNFIMRKDFEGMQASVDYGISSRQDGQRTGGSFTFGQSGEKGNVVAGVNYNKFDSISSADRDFSKNATYLYGGTVSVRGSSRNPRGRLFLDLANSDALGCTSFDDDGNPIPGSATRTPGAAGSSLADYRCYKGSADSFNYQATNLIQTPQERTNAFFLGNYQLTDDVSAFVEYYHNKTSANFGIAALPFDADSDGVVISKDNYYNPFGINFGPVSDTDDNQFLTRFTSLGQRAAFFNTTTDQFVAGLEGFLGDSWKWDVALNYGHQNQSSLTRGYVYYEGLKDALGPSFLDTDGVVKCGTAGNVIDGCTPLNIFNIDDPQTIATLGQYTANPLSTQLYMMKSIEANASGELFQMPAGAAQLAFGAQWRKEYLRSDVDFITIADANGQCFIAQEACGSPVSGSYTSNELYGELFLPLLKDAPFAKSLNVTLGTRYSDFDLFGNNTSSKLQVEWRPIDDLLLRGTVAEVFRAPSIADVFAGPAGNAPQFIDPCVGYEAGGGHENACGAPTGATNIPAGGTQATGLGQSTGVVSGSAYAGYKLAPEQGKSFDWGVVYDPSWLPGFSVSVDYWRIYLNDLITTIGAQTAADACYADETSSFCSFIHRKSNGQVSFISQPTVNLGRLDTKGWDLALRYKLPDTSWGSWTFGLDATYIAQYDIDVGGGTTSLAGIFNKDFGNYSRVRGRLFTNWNMGDWSASYRMRYISGYAIASADGGCQNDPAFCYSKDFSSYVTHSISASYALPKINSTIELGVDNLTDKQPQMLYQNNVLNANTDVNTFDTIGRYFFGRYTVKF